LNRAAYDAAWESLALGDRSDRTLLLLEGRDPTAMLQGLATNDVSGVAAGACVYNALLTPKGRMVADLRVLPGPDGALLLDVPAGARAAVLDHLGRYVPPRMARASAFEGRVLGVYGPAATGRLAAVLEVDIDDSPDALTRAPDGLLAAGTDFAGVPGVDVVGPETSIATLEARLQADGASRLDADALEALRVEAGSPLWGAELDEDRIPIEAGIEERAISQTKGCYTGQEVIIRILHRGHVNWHLRGFEATGAVDVDSTGKAAPALAVGAELAEPGEPKVVARITSAADSPRLGRIALGYARKEIAPGAELGPVAGPATGSVRVVSLPFPRA
jgi:folate-binding protein YgfZ